MRTKNQLPNTLHFIRLANVAKQLGAQSKRQFVADFRTLSHRERREIADLLKKEG
jgi:hypothetical protein